MLIVGEKGAGTRSEFLYEGREVETRVQAPINILSQ